MLNELVIGKAAALWKTVHAIADFEEDVSIDDEACECVLFDEDIGKQGGWYPHVFLAFHGGVEEDILGVGAHKTRAGSGNSAVDQYLDGGDLGAGCGGDARVVDEVAANCLSHAVGIRFLAVILGNDGLKIGSCASW